MTILPTHLRQQPTGQNLYNNTDPGRYSRPVGYYRSDFVFCYQCQLAIRDEVCRRMTWLFVLSSWRVTWQNITPDHRLVLCCVRCFFTPRDLLSVLRDLFFDTNVICLFCITQYTCLQHVACFSYITWFPCWHYNNLFVCITWLFVYMMGLSCLFTWWDLANYHD